MPKQSAGILLYRIKKNVLQIFLVHPGGPFWKNKDEGSWQIPKGEFTSEDRLIAAKREFLEETGNAIEGNFISLSPLKQKGGKLVFAFAVEGECNESDIHSNDFEMEYPPKSGRFQSFPEIDRAAWFSIEEAKNKMLPSQLPLLNELVQKWGTI